jgi:hypothetical protein
MIFNRGWKAIFLDKAHITQESIGRLEKGKTFFWCERTWEWINTLMVPVFVVPHCFSE